MRIPLLLSTAPVAVVSLFPVEPSDRAPKTSPDGTPKVAPDGSPLFRCPSARVVLLDDDGTPVREERNASIAVVRPCSITPGQPLYLGGQAWATPYSTDGGRVGLSLVAETLTPERPGSDDLPPLHFGGTK